MRFGSVCSGIEAASVAWHPLGWHAAWLAEIEPFPSAVLAHHYPDVPNLGDMTRLPRRILLGEVEAPDLFCGGTPCQAFSVAGLRRSLDDERGNLSLTFCEIADAIDHVRGMRGEPPAIVFWENVPGVLSTKDNAFGCFLAGLAGEDEPLVPPGGKWANAGAVHGPQRTIAWRTLDAQYFGVAQRRRRVFVVASARAGFDPAQVLFEWDGVRRDTAPSREAGKVPAPCVTAGSAERRWPAEVAGPLYAAYGDKWGSHDDFEKHAASLYPGHPVAFGGNRTSGSIDITPALLAQPSSGWKGDFESETFLVQPTHTLRGEGFDASEDGTGRGTPPVPVGFTRCDYGNDAVMDGTPTMRCGSNYSAHLAVAFHPTQDPISSADGSTHALGCGSSGGQASVAVATVAAFKGGQGSAAGGIGYDEHVSPTLSAADSGSNRTPALLAAMQVRRLTPVECERLQGFPDNYTAIPWRKKPADQCPDGPRYKALGNSWAVPVVRWIGRRIAAAL
jgi:DNA (cytosine-5)-methyltransferase 1